MLLTFFSLWVASVAALAAYIARPWYFPPAPEPHFQVVTSAPILDKYLEPYADAVGEDLPRYRNHCLRTLSYARYVLAQDNGWAEERIEDAMPVVEAALAYHDLGLWTDDTLDYLEPSASRATRDLADAFNVTDIKIISEIIVEHHKWSPWHGPGEDLVNAVRKADWVDASLGIARTGISAGNLAKANEEHPNAGFHKMLADFGARLHPNELVKRLEILRIFKL